MEPTITPIPTITLITATKILHIVFLLQPSGISLYLLY